MLWSIDEKGLNSTLWLSNTDFNSEKMMLLVKVACASTIDKVDDLDRTIWSMDLSSQVTLGLANKETIGDIRRASISLSCFIQF